MFIRFFRNAQFANLLMLPLILLMLWVFVLPKEELFNSENAFPLFLLLAKYTQVDNPLVIAICIVCIVVQSLLLSKIINRHGVLSEHSHLPALMYVVLMSSFPEQLSFSPLIAANFALLFMFNSVLHCYGPSGAAFPAFDAGLFTGLAALFYWPSLILFGFIVGALGILRPYSKKELLAALLGVVLPFLFLAAGLFWFDMLSVDKLVELFQPFWLVQITAVYNQSYVLLFSILGFIIIASLIQFSKQVGSFAKVKTRKFQWVLILLLIFAIAAYLVSNKKTMVSLSFLSIPLSMLLSNYFIAFKRVWLAELIFLSLLAAIIYNQVIHFNQTI